jgi:hypothetical protein
VPWPTPRRSLTPTSFTTAGSSRRRQTSAYVVSVANVRCVCARVCVRAHRLGNTPLSRLPIISPPECVHALTRTSALGPAPCRAVWPWPCTCASTFSSCTACVTCPVHLFARGVCGSNTTHLSPQNTGTKIGVFLCCSQTADGATTTPSAPPTPHAPDTLCRDFQLCALQVPRKYIS